MPVMAENKTKPTTVDVTAFLDGVEYDRRRAEGHALRELMERVTGEPATMWGPTIVGFGTRPYPGRTGTTEWMVVGFSPRKAALSIYGLYHGVPDPLLDELGPHTTGRGCLYVKRLDAVDLGVLERLVRQGFERF
jgi:hypothetical protein